MKHFVPHFLYYWSHLGPEQTSAAVTAILQTQLRLPPELRLRLSSPHRSASTPLPFLPLCPFSSPSRHQNIQIFCSSVSVCVCVSLCCLATIFPLKEATGARSWVEELLKLNVVCPSSIGSVSHTHTHTQSRCGMKR